MSAQCAKSMIIEWNCHELLDHFGNDSEERPLDHAASHLLEGVLRHLRTTNGLI